MIPEHRIKSNPLALPEWAQKKPKQNINTKTETTTHPSTPPPWWRFQLLQLFGLVLFGGHSWAVSVGYSGLDTRERLWWYWWSLVPPWRTCSLVLWASSPAPSWLRFPHQLPSSFPRPQQSLRRTLTSGLTFSNFPVRKASFSRKSSAFSQVSILYVLLIYSGFARSSTAPMWSSGALIFSTWTYMLTENMLVGRLSLLLMSETEPRTSHM